ncbi:MAG: InlB B-repeat-containing protein [Oscillospiraceae bacterium]|nr:InlB B-repeat-containing protein [Oscillospiraceae bacterium]
MPASSASARKNGGGVYACGGEIRSNVYPAGYDIGDKTLYAIDAPVVNIEGGVVEGNIYNWYNPNEYYINSVVYGYSGGGGRVRFNGAGILRLKMSTAKPDGSSKIQQLRPDSISFAENLLYRTDTDGSCREEITVYTCDGIFLSSKGVYEYWSYSEKNLYPTHYGEYYGSFDRKSDALNLKDVMTKTLSISKLVAMENSTNMVNPYVDEGFEIPEMTVKSGATLILKFDKDRDYAFTKPIYLEGGTIEINGGGGSGIIKGLDVRGKGTVIFHGGTVSGDVEKTVKVVMDNETYSSGNIDIPDYGNVVDGTGNTVHKFAYKAETEYDYFRRVCIIREVEERDFLWFEGKFHIAENGDKMLYLWTDRADRPHRIGAYPTADCIREDEQTLPLKYGTNTFAPGTPFTLKENGVFVAKAGDNVVLSPLAGGNPTDLQKSFVTWVKWYVSKDGGESFGLVQRTQGPTADNTDGPYASKTIRFEYVLPEITEEQNGYIYRCEICYWDAFTWERTSYYYDATLYVDTPQLKEPDRYVDGQPARLEMTHGTTLDGITFGYRWELSRSGGIRWETVKEGDSAVCETAAVTDAMEGWQIRVVYSIYANGKKLSDGTTDPVTIDTIGKLPVITKHPESVVHRLTEVLDDLFPPDPDKITIIIDTYYAFSVEAEGEDLHYRWQRSKDNGRTFEDLSNEDEARTKGWYKVAAGTTWQYRCIVYNDFGSVISDVATTRTLYPPTTSNPQDLTVPEHTDAVFRVDITQGLPYGTDVIWQVSKDGKTMVDVTAEDGTVNVYSEVVNGEIHWYTTLTVSNVSQDMSGYMYRCIVKNQPNDENYNGLRRSWHATLTVTYNCAVDGHKFDEGTVTSEANCTDAGCKVFTCSACGYVDERVLAPLGHDWKAATCRSVKTCLRAGCGISEGNFDYTNHIGTPVWNEDEWGDVDGHISKWSCCGTVEHPYERHTFLDGVCPTCGCVCSHPLTFPATCVAQGTCQICGLVTEEINPNNHDLDPSGTYVADEKEPTCTEEGYTGDTVCWNCRGVITKGTVIPANGHSDSWPATCKEPAWCSVCREHFGDVDPDNHAEPWSANYENITETTHDKHWYCCGMVKTEPHDPDENGVCRSCHYGCEHTGGEANCMEPAHCEKCGEPYGEKNPNRHKYTQKYACDNATHVERCKCGVIIGVPEPHTWENGWCTECYYDCRHIGGTATCTEEAICENCGERYGNAKGHTFGGWIKDATGHWHACADCGEKADEAAHTPGDAATETAPQLCTVCHYEIMPATGHTHSFDCENPDEIYLKSAATCRAKAVYYYSCSCGVSGEETFTSGETLPHHYSDGWFADGEKHWRACTACGQRSEEAAHEDTDGNHGCDICQLTISVCNDANNDHMCDICGKMLSMCRYATDWSSDAYTHWHACVVCGRKADEAAHADTDKDHNCDICGKILSECADVNKDHKCDLCGKTLSECTDNNKDHKCDICGKTLSECADDNKDHKCDLCGKTLSECADNNKDHKCDVCGKQLTVHTGGTATCTEKATCSICGQEYGELAAHTYKTEWSTDETNHWHECSVCGDRKDEAAHIPGAEATETTPQTCTVCDYVIREVLKSVTVCFNANGGSGTMLPVTGTIGETFTAPDCSFVAPDGCRFKGWALENGTEVVSFTLNSDVTLFAVWESEWEAAIRWALESGMFEDDGSFDPKKSMTIGEFWYRAWKAAGSPAATGRTMYFVDVPADAYYYEAVLWALEHKYINTPYHRKLKPDSVMTRQMIIMSMYGISGKPFAEGNVHFTDTYYRASYIKALDWAVETGIVTDTVGGAFKPHKNASGEDILLWMFRMWG